MSSLGDVESALGNDASAERFYREALSTVRQLNNKEGLALITGNLAALALQRGRLKTAEKLSREALELSEQVGRQELVATDCLRLADALAGQGQANEALPYAERAVDIFTHLRQTGFLADAQEVLNQCRSENDD